MDNNPVQGGKTMEVGRRQHRNCEGPNSMYIKLVSSDGKGFIIKREHALMSGTIRAMLTGPGEFAERETNTIYFYDISSDVLKEVCKYFAYKAKYDNSTSEIPEFKIKVEMALQLLLAANFLDC